VVVPSLSEAFGLTAADALALGVPVVASAVGGLPDIVLEGETGLLVPPADAGAIAAAVSRLLDDPELARRLGAAGAERVESKFTDEAMVRKYLDAYEGLLGQ
jgi:glycosyltransferase involved in cell wall biosynthesis